MSSGKSCSSLLDGNTRSGLWKVSAVANIHTVRHEILARIIFGVFFKCTRLAEEILANFNDTQYVLLDVFYVV